MVDRYGAVSATRRDVVFDVSRQSPADTHGSAESVGDGMFPALSRGLGVVSDLRERSGITPRKELKGEQSEIGWIRGTPIASMNGGERGGTVKGRPIAESWSSMKEPWRE
jgi:hypothetical protein